MNNERIVDVHRICEMCGKEIICDCAYADYGLVKLDGMGQLKIEFDACPDCLQHFITEAKKLIKYPFATKPWSID